MMTEPFSLYSLLRHPLVTGMFEVQNPGCEGQNPSELRVQ